jgi:crotonobetainyl-CoA:carnitine CoA-transferase CaiB-like acyl-CoA transferase
VIAQRRQEETAMNIEPLKGLKVLDLTLLPPGGYCTLQLADFGAEVIRVESPALAGKPSLVIGQVGLSRGKRSITLDQRNPGANAVLRRLAAVCDIVVENAKPGAMAARGWGYPQASQETPGLIWCSITGFGQDGPYADRAGHDLSYLGHAGLLSALNPDLPWHPAAMLSVPIGAMAAAMGVLAAVVERNRTGKGCQIDISIAEACTWVLAGAPGSLKEGYAGMPPAPERRLYACADGRFISLAAAEPRTWAALCEGVDAPDLADKLYAPGEAGRAAGERLAAIFAAKPAGEWVAKLGPMGAAVCAVNQGADVVNDPQVAARGAVLTVAGEPCPANPIRFLDAEGRRSGSADSAPPRVGEHTDTVLAEAGYSAGEIADMRAGGVI